MLILQFLWLYESVITAIFTLSLHDALPISSAAGAFGERAMVVMPERVRRRFRKLRKSVRRLRSNSPMEDRSEEHTSELQSLRHLVCRLLLAKETRGRGCGT